MRFPFASVRWLGLLALACLNVAGAQVPPPLPSLPVDALAQTLPAGLAQPFEQAWDVVELAGQPMLSDSQRPARVVLRPQGLLWVDGGCNYFSGRVERDAQGLFRISKYGGTHRACEVAPRSEAFLNSALMMVDNFRWDRGLLLRSGSSELLRLRPSANQDIQALEQGLMHRALPASATVAALPARERQVTGQDCHPVKAKKAAAKSRKAKPPVCQPVQSKAVKGRVGKEALRAASTRSAHSAKSAAKSTQAAKPGKSSAKPSKAQRVKAGPVAKGSAKKSTPAAHKRSKS